MVRLSEQLGITWLEARCPLFFGTKETVLTTSEGQGQGWSRWWRAPGIPLAAANMLCLPPGPPPPPPPSPFSEAQPEDLSKMHLCSGVLWPQTVPWLQAEASFQGPSGSRFLVGGNTAQ